MPALGTNEYGDTMLKELQVAGATSTEVVGALNERIYALDAGRTAGVDAPYEFDQALRAYLAL